MGFYEPFMHALRDALEEQLDMADSARVNCKIQVACEWITHASTGLLRWVQDNIGYADLETDPTQKFPGGPLYTGPEAACLRRWSFWQSRLEELGNDPDLHEGIRKMATKAAETMDAVERRFAHSL